MILKVENLADFKTKCKAFFVTGAQVHRKEENKMFIVRNKDPKITKELNEIRMRVTKRTLKYEKYLNLKSEILKNYLFYNSDFSISLKEFKTDQDLWDFIICQYFVSDEYLMNIIAELEDKEEVTIDEEKLLELCNDYRKEFEFAELRIPRFRINILEKLHWIKRESDNRLKYLRSMQNAIIECIAIPYNKDAETSETDKNTGIDEADKYAEISEVNKDTDGSETDKSTEISETNKDVEINEQPQYPYKTLKLTEERILADKKRLKEGKAEQDTSTTNSRGELILSWKDNIQNYSFDVFDNANKRLFLKNTEKIDMKVAESWNNMTGSIFTNTVYGTLKKLDNEYKFIKSRMEEKVLKEIFFCIEKLLAVRGMGSIEKAKFMEYMISNIPALLDKIKQGDGKKLKPADFANTFNSMANAINKLDIYEFKKICKEEIRKTVLTDKKIKFIKEKVYFENINFIIEYSKSQKDNKNDTIKSKNTIFFEQISRAVLYNTIAELI